MNNILTNSCLYSFKSCRRRYWFAYECGIRPETDTKALRMGTAGHAGLESAVRGNDFDVIFQAVRNCYSRCPDHIEQYDWMIECQTMLTLVGGYLWYWGESPFSYEAIEMPFHLPLINPRTEHKTRNFRLAGKVDGVAHLEDDRLAVIEHKFISDSLDSDSDFWRILERDPQITLYLHAARKLGYDAQTILYDVVRKPTIKPNDVPVLDDNGLKFVLDKNGERVLNKRQGAGGQGKPRQTADTKKEWVVLTRPMTPEEWGTKLNEDIGKRPEFYFARHEIPRLDNDIFEYLDELWQIQKTIRNAQLQNRWYRTATKDSCTWCQYQGICSNRFDPKTDALPEGFVRLNFPHTELKGLQNVANSPTQSPVCDGTPTAANNYNEPKPIMAEDW